MPAQGFAAQTAGAVVILAATSAGYPLSTTHVISGGITGAGAAKSVSAVRWGVAGDIVRTWILTLPATACLAALVYGVTTLFGHGALGPVVVAAALLLITIAVVARRIHPAVAFPVTS